MDTENVMFLHDYDYDDAAFFWDAERKIVKVVYGGRCFSQDEWTKFNHARTGETEEG
jgi:hypothetical protein